MALKPLTHPDPLYQLLRDGDIKEFNRRKAQGEATDLTHCDLRSLDLRGIDAAGLDFSHCYFRTANPARHRLFGLQARRCEPQ